ncbi:hypothetical protein [Pseudaminobacter sp. NGMCC 1.201702]|uniref:hypothetical protein n=1 Tax=Pseudaminobacter sp. NGMCC 1.201702 TaxID=3391825 RepID=UPI0039EEFE7D
MTDWIEWRGGECPVRDGTTVDIKTRMRTGVQYPDASLADWSHIGSATDIIAYRIVKEEP